MQAGSPGSTASQPPKTDRSWFGRLVSAKHPPPLVHQGVIPLWQIKWVVYVSGRRYSICYQLDQAFREARILVNDIEIMRKAYRLIERVSSMCILFSLSISQRPSVIDNSTHEGSAKDLPCVS